MDKLLVIGAGRSSSSLITYLLDKAAQNNWRITVADADEQLAQQKIAHHPNGQSTRLDVFDEDIRSTLIEQHDLVVSMLPAHLHYLVAEDCLRLGKHLLTASYVSDQLKELGDKARAQGLIFLGELGLDPGIDHMSAMEIIHAIKKKGGHMTGFRSYTGGLIAPESDTNPWHYKFTWNPRNVVLAGQGTAVYLSDDQLRYTPYQRLFADYELVDIPGLGQLEMYANRDSLMYREIYGLDDIPTLLRGTLRHRGYCDAWNALIRIGLTDDKHATIESPDLTWRALMEGYAPQGNAPLQDRIAALVGYAADSEVMAQLAWLGLFEDRKIGLKHATPAQALQHLLLDKWSLAPGDKDMIVMQHEFDYTLNGNVHRTTSTLIMKGDDEIETAMSKLVGLPLGIVARLVAENTITSATVQVPTTPDIYLPVLRELETMGVRFHHQDSIIHD